MALPEPKVPLTDACSVIFNNTLYTYSADAFQSLPLTAGAEWTQLPQGEKVTGGVCVGATTGEASTSAFFVVGGKGSSADYQGLQKFTYSTGKWESISLPKPPVTQDRLWHGATYINSTDSILIYAGSQKGTREPTSETFTIGASAPHLVFAFESIAPPALDPILFPWSTSEVVLMGGSASNKNVMLFSSERSWFDSGASLAAPLEKDTSAVKAAIMTGADGSKHLYTFDMTLSPNSVQRTVLFNGTGVPVQNAVPVTKRALTEEVEAKVEDVSRVERRDDDAPLTLANWPAYNSTLAPTSTRGNYALATDPNGLVVVAGGNTDDVLCMFNTRENGWQNATALLSKLKILSIESSTTLSSSSFSPTTSTSSPTSASTNLPASATTAVAATTTAAVPAVPPKYTGPETNTILAAVLGSIFGLAVVLFGVYCCLQRKRKQQAHLEAGHTRRASGIASVEKDGIGMSSDSLHSGLGGTGTFRGHQTQESAGSFSSMAILMGRINHQKPGHSAPGRNLSYSSKHTKNSSADSTFRAFKSTISKPIPQETQPVMLSVPRSPRPDTRDEKGVSFAPNTVEPKPRNPAVAAAIDAEGSTRRSSGWNRYWSGGSVSLFGLGGGGNGNGNGNSNINISSKRETVDSDRSSHYSNPNRMTQDSATVPPLRYNVNEPRASFSRVNTQSPTIAQYDKKMVMEGMSGQIETQRPVSGVSSVSGYSSGIPASVTEAWDPTESSMPWGANRGPSSAYSASIYTTYSTPLAPATHNARVPPPPPLPVPRDDMSWLNLGDNGR
ncbi:hypothetical protein B0T22DRAFT_100271 [Podospora appendiculata]|uniref:Pre-mRNA splicing factor CLF1 n=1 Tax=Podospora appendiculata TaxID=314037 RepID=A0AAE0XKY0_9PEZI|nr:hypothetical protein B0T22DRAFT_100271 [Podospora appendiculata]